jgi:hypothetical protein
MFLHVLDHPYRSEIRDRRAHRYIENPYLDGPQPSERFHPDHAPL